MTSLISICNVVSVRGLVYFLSALLLGIDVCLFLYKLYPTFHFLTVATEQKCSFCILAFVTDCVFQGWFHEYISHCTCSLHMVTTSWRGEVFPPLEPVKFWTCVSLGVWGLIEELWDSNTHALFGWHLDRIAWEGKSLPVTQAQNTLKTDRTKEKLVPDVLIEAEVPKILFWGNV